MSHDVLQCSHVTHRCPNHIRRSPLTGLEYSSGTVKLPQLCTLTYVHVVPYYVSTILCTLAILPYTHTIVVNSPPRSHTDVVSRVVHAVGEEGEM